jgi:hypothetical protein
MSVLIYVGIGGAAVAALWFSLEWLSRKADGHRHD